MDVRPNLNRLARRLLCSRFSRLRDDLRGATAVEYGFVVALIVLAMLGALSGVGNATSSMWNNVNDKVTNPH